MAKVLTTRRDDEGQVRSVTVQTGTGSVLDRPVNKPVLLLESPETLDRESQTRRLRNCDVSET